MRKILGTLIFINYFNKFLLNFFVELNSKKNFIFSVKNSFEALL